MAIADMAGALSPVTALALVGVAGVGAPPQLGDGAFDLGEAVVDVAHDSKIRKNVETCNRAGVVM